MKFIDNITSTVKRDMENTITKGSRISIAASYFSIFAFEALKKELQDIAELRFIFTSPTFISEKAAKEKREFYIPRLRRERSLYGTEFEGNVRLLASNKEPSGNKSGVFRIVETFVSDWMPENDIDLFVDGLNLDSIYEKKKFGMTPKGCYVRIGTASEPMTQSMIDNLFSKRTRNSLGKIRANRQNLTFEQLKIYYEGKGLPSNSKFASNLGLQTEQGAYNYVGYLMADNNALSFKVAKYKGKNREVPLKFELFDDRLEITSAGGLPEALNEEEFFMGYSVPRNQELMRIYKDLELVEHLGSGVPRILETYSKECFLFTENFTRMVFPNAWNLSEEVQSQPSIIQVPPKYHPSSIQVSEIVLNLNGEIDRSSLQQKLGLANRDHFRKAFLNPAINEGFIEMAIPDKPNSRMRKYRLTLKGQELQEQLKKNNK